MLHFQSFASSEIAFFAISEELYYRIIFQLVGFSDQLKKY